MAIKSNPYKTTATRCWFLLTMSLFSFIGLVILNIYIAYLAIEQFRVDGWSFLGGLIIGTSYLATIPILIFSGLSIRMIQNDNKKKYYFPIILGIISIIMGILLHNATALYVYIILAGFLLLISTFICAKEKDISDDSDKKEQTQKKLITPENGIFKLLKAFQVVGLILLFFLASSAIGSFFIPKETADNNRSFAMYYIIFSSVIFILHLVVTFAFFKKKKWALHFKYIESYIVLSILIITAVAGEISEGGNLLIILGFSPFIAMFIYLIINYKKLKKSNTF